ncbi:MAG: hypothetical protein ACRYFX_24070 [Janthinobacterium lividum]
MSETPASVAQARATFSARMQALDVLLAAARGRGVLAEADIRDSSNRTGCDWPSWGVEISHTYANGPENYRLSATVRQACTFELAIGELQGSPPSSSSRKSPASAGLFG